MTKKIYLEGTVDEKGDVELTESRYIPKEDLAIIPHFEKPKVPQFVMDFYNKNCGECSCLSDWFDYIYSECDEEIFKWLFEPNSVKREEREFAFAAFICKGVKAVEIVKEPLYYVKLLNIRGGYLNISSIGSYRSLGDKEQTDFTQTKFTEKEIKDIDDRYWQFAVPVEEDE